MTSTIRGQQNGDATGFPGHSNPHTYLQYHCLSHSTGISPNALVTVAIRKLYCSLSSPSPSTASSLNLYDSNNSGSQETNDTIAQQIQYGSQYRVLVTLTGIAGLPLHPVPISTTTSSPLARSEESQTGTISPRMSLTHSCSWDAPLPSPDIPAVGAGRGVSCITPPPSAGGGPTGREKDNVLVLPIRYKDIPRDAALSLEILGSRGTTIAKVSLPLWDSKGRLKMGLETVAIPLAGDRDGDEDMLGAEEAREEGTECALQDEVREDEKWSATLVLDELDQIDKRTQKMRQAPVVTTSSASTGSGMRGFRSGRFKSHSSNMSSGGKNAEVIQSELVNSVGQQSSPWLDKMTRQRCMEILNDSNERISEEKVAHENEMSGVTSSNHVKLHLHPYHFVPGVEKKKKAYLVIELPSCELPIVHEENLYTSGASGASGSVQALDLSLYHHEKQRVMGQKKAKSGGVASNNTNIEETLFIPMPNPLHPQDDLRKMGLGLVQVLDQESPNDNPVEDKYRALQHDLLRGLVDPALKPNLVEKSRLNIIIGGTSQHLTVEEKDLLWKFRFSLVDNRQALTKFLLAVDWTVESEVVQAAELLEQWRKRSPIEVSDALKLLGKNVAFQTGLVRTYAISTLAEAPDGELVLYLLQLVQALRYDNISNQASKEPKGSDRKSSLGAFLIDRASKNMELANYLYWYLKVETEDVQYGQTYLNVFKALQEKLSQIPMKTDSTPTQQPQYTGVLDSVSKLGSSLSEKASGRVKCSITMWDVLSVQDTFITSLMECQQTSRFARGKKDTKEQHLREQLKSKACSTIHNGWAVPLPSAPNIQVTGVEASTAIMFTSALYPALLEFHVHSGNLIKDKKDRDNSKSQKKEVYKVIVKTGDDLRQDQLVIALIKLMDRILKRGALDLCLIPYDILATGPTSGLVEFVQNSVPISNILDSNNNSILNFFKKNAPLEGVPYGVNPEVMQTYIRSCAGYCVITYLIGVGDRHLDNMMIQQNGHFFHIDFGYIFGRDPKPFPPAFRLTREMVDGMGGVDSPEYKQFCSLACQAFNLLRKRAGLVLNLLHLMSDAGIEDLSNNPSTDTEGVISKVEERFQLALTDEQAEAYFLRMINVSLSAITPKIVDITHRWAKMLK